MEGHPEVIRTGARHEEKLGKIKEIAIATETRFVTHGDEVMDELRRLYVTSGSLLICSTHEGLVESRNRLGDIFMDLAERRQKGDHKGIRFVTSINRKQDTYLVETLLGMGFQIRHTAKFPSLSFSIVGDELGDTVVIGLWHNLVVSNDPRYVKHFRSIFEDVWADGIDANRKIEEIQSGSDFTSVEMIGNAEESTKRVMYLLKERAHELLILLSTPNALRRYVKAGVFQTIDELVGNKAMTVKVLVPSDIEVRLPIKEIMLGNSKVEFKRIDESLATKFTMLIIDREHSFILETRDDATEDVGDFLGMTTYTESKSIAASYATIFETLWKQAEMFEKLQAHEQMQNEFVNVAAHELRTPVQVIVNSVELANEKGELGEFGEVVIRSAKRLERLTQDLLDVQRIDRNALQIRREKFSLDDLLSSVVRDQELNLRNGTVKILYQPRDKEEQILADADKERITQVLSNLLSNAVEFTEDGTITVAVEERGAGESRHVRVEIKDTGKGIDPAILPVLFSKFASKSRKGSGLGLYIAKGIVEAHGGKVWGRNNDDGRGATFGFSLYPGER